MRRSLIICVICSFFAWTGSSAFAGKTSLDPPLTGDMVMLKPYARPQKLPEIMLSEASEGLSYLSRYKGQVIVLNIWATWCPPCVEELPSLNALQSAMGSNDFKVVTVSLDNDLEKVTAFMKQHHLDKLPAFIDAGNDLQRLSLLKDIPGVPVTIILNRQLQTVALYEGAASWDGRAARAVIEYYLKNLPGAYDHLAE